MPFVHIDMLEGRSPEKIAAMIEQVSHAIADTLDADIGTVRIMVNEMAPHQYGVGGRPWPLVAAERAQTQEVAP